MGNNDGPLRVARALRAAGFGGRLVTVLQKAPQGALVAAYAKTSGGASVSVASSEAESLPLVEAAAPTLIVNAFTNYRFRRLLAVAPCVNLHLGPLPRYRGRHPMHWGLINGEASFGVSLHRMNADFDDGAILWQAEVPVVEGWSVAHLREALMREVDRGIGAALLAVLRGDADERPNVAPPGAYLPRRYPADSALTEWGDPELVVRKVMALRSETYPATIPIGGSVVSLAEAAFVHFVPGVHESHPSISVTVVGWKFGTPTGRPYDCGRSERAIKPSDCT